MTGTTNTAPSVVADDIAQTTRGELDSDVIEELTSDMQDEMDTARELGEAIAAPSVDIGMDADLDAELDALLAEDAAPEPAVAAPVSATGVPEYVPGQQLPQAPVSAVLPPPAPTEPIAELDDDDAALAALQAEMNLA